MKCDECLLLIEEFFDGELGADEMVSVSTHVSRCSECSEVLEVMRYEQDVMVGANSLPNPSPGFWQNVQNEIQVERQKKPRSVVGNLRGLISSILPHNLSPAFAPAFALLILILVSGAVLVKKHFSNSEPAATSGQIIATNESKNPNLSFKPVDVPTPSKTTTGVNSNDRTGSVKVDRRVVPISEGPVKSKKAVESSSDLAELASLEKQADVVFQPASFGSDDPETSRHIERVQILMRSFRNSQSQGAKSELAFEKKLARDLLNQNIFLRRASESSGDLETVELLNSVEPLLLDIANLDQRPTKRDVGLIKNRIEKEEIVAALQVR